jgi:hypothetical protein
MLRRRDGGSQVIEASVVDWIKNEDGSNQRGEGMGVK